MIMKSQNVEKLRLNMAVGGFMDVEFTVMQLNEEMTGRLRSARPYNEQKWNVEMCMKGDDFPYIDCTDTDAAGKAYPLYGVYDGNHRALAAILSVVRFDSKLIHPNTQIRVRLMKRDTDLKILEAFSMVRIHTHTHTHTHTHKHTHTHT